MIAGVPQVIVLEDQRFAMALATALRHAGINGDKSVVGVVVRAQDALAKLRQFNVPGLDSFIDGISIDHNLHGPMTGAELAAIVREEFPDVVLICLTGNRAAVEESPAFKANPELFDRIVDKPVSPPEYAAIWIEELRRVGKAPSQGTASTQV